MSKRAKERAHYRITIDMVAKSDGVNRCSDIEHHLYMIENQLVPYTVGAEDVKYKVELLNVQGYEQVEKDLGWISVKDRLPEKNGWYFTCVNQAGVAQCVGLSHFETCSGQWDDDDDSIELVDYWMPIPELPKKEKEK